MSTLPQIDPLPEHLLARGGTGDLVAAEYLDVIRNASVNAPRSLQKRIGPSELGGPCARRIVYKLLGAPDLNPHTDVPWLPIIGTGVHLWLEEAFTATSDGHDHARWITEARVDVGEVGGTPVIGSCDLYDRVTATVIDHKVVGPTQLTKYKRQGPGQQYRTQAHLYGRGFTRRGLPVDRVMVAFLPRNAELSQAYIWHEPYDEQVALDGLARANALHAAGQALGPAALAQVPTADQFCHRCSYFKAGSTDLTQGCPGDPSSTPAAGGSRPAPLSLIGAPS